MLYKYEDLLEERDWYYIQNFEVVTWPGQWKFTRHDYHILFDDKTKIRKVERISENNVDKIFSPFHKV